MGSNDTWWTQTVECKYEDDMASGAVPLIEICPQMARFTAFGRRKFILTIGLILNYY
jgi:hypothetical protein